ncbi:M56 family metallopeptidase [Cellulosilyticum sp. I15G10I2]|uniref:M56 family metallopeptidase n=1 Tax=Cellulosilyticum sp. I15G10I2 TaxID=1892843 RepID=UPI001FA6DB18|nr:M56 family metallopeptidase [Cellulosilyticum sp. I15G10I2]
MSILGTMTGFIVLLLRKITKLPATVIYILWTVPVLRFWIPVGIASPYSLMQLIAQFTMRTLMIGQGFHKLPKMTMMNTIMVADSYFPITYKYHWLEKTFEVFAGIWLLLFAAALILCGFFYYLSKVEIKEAIHLKGNIYQSDKIAAPAVYGIFRPKIVLPYSITKEDMPYIIMHEQVHIRRWDNLIRIIIIVTACLHWFNPFIWIFLKCFFEDMEFACDAKVLKNCNTAKKKAYTKALLSTMHTKMLFASAFGGAKLKTRIEKMLLYKQLTIASSVFFGAFILVLAFILLTNAVG